MSLFPFRTFPVISTRALFVSQSAVIFINIDGILQLYPYLALSSLFISSCCCFDIRRHGLFFFHKHQLSTYVLPSFLYIFKMYMTSVKPRSVPIFWHHSSIFQNTRQVSARHFEPGTFYIGIEKIMRKGTFKLQIDLQPTITHFQIKAHKIDTNIHLYHSQYNT